MKETLVRYADFHIWANNRIIDVMQQLGSDMLDKEVASSFSSIKETVYHVWNAEYVWLQRLQLAEHPVKIESFFKGDFKEACALWQDVSLQLKDFVARQYNDAAFDHVVQYYNFQKLSKKSRVADVLIHVFNHATYHRGQLVTMLRQAGVSNIPAMDFIAYTG